MMNSKYALNGVAVSGTPLARLVELLPREGATTDVIVYVGDLKDVLASVGAKALPELVDKKAGDMHVITVTALRSVCDGALNPAKSVPVVVEDGSTTQVPLKEQLRRSQVASESSRAQK